MQAQLSTILDTREREMAQAWAKAWGSTYRELDSTLHDLAKSVGEGERLNRTLVNRSTRLQMALDAMSESLEQVSGETSKALGKDIRKAVVTAATGQVDLITAQLPQTGISVLRASPEQITAIIQRSVEQITKDMAALPASTSALIRGELVRGVTVGDNPRRTATRIVANVEKRFGFSLNRAMVISRTESLDAYRRAGQMVEQQNKDILQGWQWVCHFDDRTCRACIAMHGQKFATDEPGPIDHHQGRCARAPLTRSWKDLGFDGVEEIPSLPSAEQEFKNMSQERQKQILGKDWQAWKDGKFPLRMWVSEKPNPGWRPSISPRQAGQSLKPGHKRAWPGPLKPSPSPGIPNVTPTSKTNSAVPETLSEKISALRGELPEERWRIGRISEYETEVRGQALSAKSQAELNSVKEAGRLMNEALEKRISTRWSPAQQKEWRNYKAAFKELEEVQDKIRELENSGKFISVPLKERETSAMAYYQTASKRVSNSLSREVQELLEEVRDMGLQGGKAPNWVRVNGATKAMVEELDEALTHYPTEWVNLVNGKYSKVNVGYSPRGYHKGGNIYLSDSALSPGVAIHEAGHLMEDVVPGLREIEFLYHHSRTTLPGKEGLMKTQVGDLTMDLLRPIYPGSSEVAMFDRWVAPYTGRVYGKFGSSTEVLTTGIESVFKGSRYLDPDLFEFILGVLAIL